MPITVHKFHSHQGILCREDLELLIVDTSAIFSSLVISSAKNRGLVIYLCVFQADSEELI